MTGSIQEKNGIYYAILNFKDEKGKRKQKWISTNLAVKGNKRKAEQILQELLSKYDDTIILDPSKSLLCDYIEAWIERNQSNVQSTTYTGYRYIFQRHLYPYFKHLGITIYQVSSMHIDRYIQTKLSDGLNPNTVIKHCSIIKSALQYAKKQRLVRNNAFDWVDMPSKKRYTSMFYNKEELNELLDIVRGTNIETPVFLAAYFGFRRSEIVGLRWDDIDFTEQNITIKNKAVRLKLDGETQFIFTNELKTNSSYRSLPFNQSMYDYLLSTRERIAENKHIYGHDYCTKYEGFVCVYETGELMKPDSISAAFANILKANGLKHIRFHDLRHSCASLFLSMGYSMKEVQEWLGHSNYKTTADTYAHLEDKSKLNMTKDMGNALNI